MTRCNEVSQRHHQRYPYRPLQPGEFGLTQSSSKAGLKKRCDPINQFRPNANIKPAA
jgi:hypothetical protein